MELRKTYRFEASHILPKHPGKCSRLHGHSWVLHVSVVGSINPETGFVQDFADISKVVKPIVERMDHRHLGTWEAFGRDDEWGLTDFFNKHPWCVEGMMWSTFYPTSENLLWWIADQLSMLNVYEMDALVRYAEDGTTRLPRELIMTSHWSKVAIEETCTSYAELTREEWNARQPTSIYKQKL